MKSTRIIVGIVLLILVFTLVYAFWPRGNAPIAVVGGDDEASSVEGNTPEGELIGGVRRPTGSVDVGTKPKPSADKQAGSFDYGKSPSVPIDANPQVASVAKAISNREESPRAYMASVSALSRKQSFNANKYRANKVYRKEYLESAQPSRVFGSAEPGEGVVPLTRVGSRLRRVLQGDSTKLRVRAVAGMPVTFTSFDLGAFSNQLTTTTVEASADGVAEAEFFATSGTIADVNILASSPVNSGQVKFVVNISLPE